MKKSTCLIFEVLGKRTNFDFFSKQIGFVEKENEASVFEPKAASYFFPQTQRLFKSIVRHSVGEWRQK
jgi:hypothetical protein